VTSEGEAPGNLRGGLWRNACVGSVAGNLYKLSYYSY